VGSDSITEEKMIIPEWSEWVSSPGVRVAIILAAYLLAWIIHRLSRRMAAYLLGASRWASRKEEGMRPERLHTLNGLVAGVITFTAFAAATFMSLSLFFDSNTLIWIIGLFSAAFGLGARPIVSDFLSGISFLFEDSFDVGEKVELPGLAGGAVEGSVEAVNLRTTVIRAITGEPLVVPNGEIRVVRNYSRGHYSTANIRVRVPTADLGRALPLLEELGEQAVALLPDLLEPWHLISETGEMGQQTELTLLAKARFGRASELRPRLLTLIQERLQAAGIDLAS
jgi:small conductance mechanosensitive channel